METSYVLEQSPRDWKTTMHPNVTSTVFHTQNIRPHALKTVRTTLRYIIVLQLRGEIIKVQKQLDKSVP